MFSKLSLRTTILQIVTTCVLLLLDNFLQILQIVVPETFFHQYSREFICQFCELSSRPGYSFFASCTTRCSGHFVCKFLVQVKVGHYSPFGQNSQLQIPDTDRKFLDARRGRWWFVLQIFLLVKGNHLAVLLVTAVVTVLKELLERTKRMQ